MIKQGATLFFILLANIILLAHAAIPHHNHNKEVCIVNSHCQTNSNDSKHKHDSKKDTECCILKQVVVILTNSVRQECNFTDLNDNHQPLYDYQAILLNYELELFVSKFATNPHVPLISSSYTHFVSTALGLRAPPTV